ncbi:MAG: hypothetical protein ACRDTX_22770 [Pseudonocardiaceae bacterium]
MSASSANPEALIEYAGSDIYISADVEADGPIPGPFSMLSFGLCVAGRFDGTDFAAADPEEHTFYAELKPISDHADQAALAVSGLDRDRLCAEGETPSSAMDRASAWVVAVAGDHRPVLVGYPLLYDWLFLYWYFQRFAASGSPFGHSSGLDMKSMFMVKADVVLAKAAKRAMPAELLSTRPHTHHALADAIEQAEMFVKIFNWKRNAGCENADAFTKE